MWKEVPRDMKRYKVGEVGSFDPENVHKGVCYGWPKECNLTNLQAKTLFLNIYKNGTLTIHQLIVVRKHLSYAWELTGGVPGGNYPGVKEVWQLVRADQMQPQIHHVLPTRIPTVQELKRAFLKKWTPQSPMTFIEYCLGLVAGFDCFIFGLRSTEDVRRVKMSVVHQWDWDNGWMCTAFKGGRAKLSGTKKGTRPWKIWTVCLCPKGKHTRPPAMFNVMKSGNPREPLTWNSNCPVAVIEFLFSLQWTREKRRYPKWLGSGKLGQSNINDVAGLAVNWFVGQGVVTVANAYNRNAGRKSLARWCAHLRVPYEQSFQCHGDLFEVWAKNYESGVAPTTFKGRTQSLDPARATTALLRFADFVMGGRRVRATLTKSDRFNYHLLKSMGKVDLAERIAHDLPTDDDESDEEMKDEE